MKVLVVGDMHVVPGEIQDCENLLKLIVESADKYKVEQIVFLGDQHHCHDTLNSKVMAFWWDAIHYKLNQESVFLIGNHDFQNPSSMMPHSMVVHKLEERATIVDQPVNVLCTDFCAMPYYYNPLEFIEAATKLKQNNPEIETLFCHETFTGADEGVGYFAKEAVEPSAIPFANIWSGHIHKPMVLGKVKYPGSPRWRTLSDADIPERHIYVLEDGKAPIAIPTSTHCTKIYKFEDSELEPLNINLTPDQLTRADLRIQINGTSEYITKRMSEFKAKYSAKCRGVPIRNKSIKASESEGITTAFQKYTKAFTPPNGTDKDHLMKECYARLGLGL